jgi:STE24 endopeptidase
VGSMGIVYVALVVGVYVGQWLLETLNVHRLKTDNHRLRSEYLKAKSYLQRAMQGWQAVFWVLLLPLGGFNALYSGVNEYITNPQSWGFMFTLLLLLGALQWCVQQPFALYSTFKIEAQAGFNTTTWGQYWKDEAKGLVVTMLLLLPIYTVAWLLMQYSGVYWWLWVGAGVVVFQILLLVIYPLWIAPIFNAFTPLQNVELQQSVLGLSAQSGLPIQSIQVMDGSRRSNHSNAFFWGIGKAKSIVLYDTLLAQLTHAEILAVIAHEIGHYKKKHIITRVGVSWFGLWAFLFCVQFTHSLGIWSTVFQLPDSLLASMVACLGVWHIVGFIVQPIANGFSRAHEFQADAFAHKAVGHGESLACALRTLQQQNYSHPNPHPWYALFYYSHPTVAERIGALQKLDDWANNQRTTEGAS